MHPAELDGYATGCNDIRIGRWDGDNVIPPFFYVNFSKEWYEGYQRAYREHHE